jgi:acetaldehyde dehydrogenase (acetylating)
MAEEFDKDLQSIQEARHLVKRAKEAQKVFFRFNQYEVDTVVAAMAEAGYRNAEKLAKLAVEETGMGVVAHKVIKNVFGSRDTWEAIKDVKTVGVIGRDEAKKIVEIAWPYGVIAALTPTTNPTSTVLNNALIAVKARNAIVFAPHPASVRCASETTRIVEEAAEAAGAPPGLVSIMTHVSMQGTTELMRHEDVSLLMATGGTAMVRAAHSMGKPVYGVGPGNVPVYVDRSADIEKAARDIVNGASFDNSVICACEGAVVADKPIAEKLAAEMERDGAMFLDDVQAELLGKAMFRPNGLMEVDFVGRSAIDLGKMVGFTVPDHVRLLVARLYGVGPDFPLSREKLAPVVGFMVEDGWRRGCERCIEVLEFEGLGHTMGIHCKAEDIIMEFGLEKPAMRIIVNTSTMSGAIGANTGLEPAMTLATGGIGGGISSDNICVKNLMNVKRMCYELTPFNPPAVTPAPLATPAAKPAEVAATPSEVEAIVRQVVEQLAGKS